MKTNRKSKSPSKIYHIAMYMTWPKSKLAERCAEDRLGRDTYFNLLIGLNDIAEKRGYFPRWGENWSDALIRAVKAAPETKEKGLPQAMIKADPYLKKKNR